jgi:biopolymer transport protein ExbD
MAESPDDKLAEGKLDLVPMIDCIMLLLLFFILTTKFVSEEKSISSLLPTDKGQAASSPSKVTPPEQVNICIFPAGMEKALQPSEYLQALREVQTSTNPVINKVWIRIGIAPVIAVDGSLLKIKQGTAVVASVDEIHRYISDELAKFESANPSDRQHQSPVVINCFSGLSWKFALVSYDAVRAYEARVSGRKLTGDKLVDFDGAREVDFAPPRIRDYTANELGNELYEIVNMK